MKQLTKLLVIALIFLAILIAGIVFIAAWNMPGWAVNVIVGSIAVSMIVALGAGLFYFCAFNWQKLQMVKDERYHGSYQVVQDGLGQSYVIRSNGKILNLTTNAKTHIEDIAIEPTQAELTLQALFFQAIGKGHVSQNGNGSQLALTAPELIPDLMPILDKAQRVLIKAVSDGGKTTLLRHIADRRQGAVLVLDSQSYPDKWPSKCKVVGTGSDHQAISIALDNLIELMVKRYKEIGEGLVKEGQHPKLTIIIDEWMAIVDQCANAQDAIRRLLTESRKAAMSVFIGSHSERVKSLGLDGRGDLRDGFLIVRVEVENGQRVATYDQGHGEKPCVLPGEYTPEPTNDEVLEIEAITEPVASGEEQRVLDMIDEGKPHRAITEAVWQQRGSFYNDKVNVIARKFGREMRKN